MTKHLLFDMGGVIFDQDTDEACRRFAALGIDTGRYIGQFGQKEFFLELEDGTISDEEFRLKLSELTGRDISWKYAQYCWLGFFRCVQPRKLRHLEALREMGYHLCLLSNTNPFIMAHTRSSSFCEQGRPITDYFDDFFCSYEMHSCKPDTEIFLKTLDTGRMKAEECLFIDDSLRNTQAAELVGIPSLHVPSNEDWMDSLLERLQTSGRLTAHGTEEKAGSR